MGLFKKKQGDKRGQSVAGKQKDKKQAGEIDEGEQDKVNQNEQQEEQKEQEPVPNMGESLPPRHDTDIQKKTTRGTIGAESNVMTQASAQMTQASTQVGARSHVIDTQISDNASVAGRSNLDSPQKVDKERTIAQSNVYTPVTAAESQNMSPLTPNGSSETRRTMENSDKPPKTLGPSKRRAPPGSATTDPSRKSGKNAKDDKKKKGKDAKGKDKKTTSRTSAKAKETKKKEADKKRMSAKEPTKQQSVIAEEEEESPLNIKEPVTFKDDESPVPAEDKLNEENYELGEGRLYTGQMVKDQGLKQKMVPHGQGTLTEGENCIYEGNFHFGVIQKGSIFYANGDRYEGEFKDGKPGGYGNLKQLDGTIYEGKWENGAIVTGKETNPNGEIYDGNFHNRKRHGQGQCVKDGKCIYTGLWEFGAIKQQNTEGAEGEKRIGTSDVNGKNAQLKFANNQELTKDEQIERQNKMNDYIWNNENAVEQALEQHDKAIEDIQKSFDPPRVSYNENGEKLEEDKCSGHCLETHKKGYEQFYHQYKEDQENDRWSYETLKKQLQENPIMCTKYNYTLEKEVMNHFQFECKLQLSEDGETLILHNNKMSTNPVYIYEKTPEDILEMRKQMKEATLLGEEYKEPEKPYEYNYLQSSSTCNISDIQGIIYNGASSRFWIYRKHLISLDYDSMKFDRQAKGVKCSYPFFSWQCLTLEFSTRTVDLVIKDQDQMDILLRFLVQALDTVDGTKGSAEFYVEAALHYEIERQEKALNKKTLKARAKLEPLAEDEEFDESLQIVYLTDEQKQQIKLQKQKEIYRQTMFKYTMMRVRAKIGYYAFMNRRTINEHILCSIQRSYNELTQSKQIPPIAPYTKELIDEFEMILNAPVCSTLKLLMDLAKNPIVVERKKQLLQAKEIQKRFGVKFMHQLTLEQRAEMDEVIERLFGKEVEEKINKKSKDFDDKLSQSGKKSVISKEEADDGPKINKFMNTFSLFDKSKCSDIYSTVKVDGLNMYEQRSQRVMLKYKLDRQIIEQQLLKVRFMLGIGDLIDIFYIKTVLLKKALMKKQFVITVEHNLECYIPDELSCDRYPKSFRYYDPIIQIVNQLFSQKQKLYHCLKTDFYLKKIKGKDFKKTFLERYGIITTAKTRKQQYDHALKLESEQNDVKHSQSKHHMSLQKSRYLMVESTEEGLMMLADLQTYVIEQKWERGPHERIKCLEDQTLELRFAHQGMVNLKRQKFIVFKQSQYARHDHLKNQGQKFGTVRLVERYVRQNFETLYTNRPRDIDYNPKALEKNLDLIPFNKLTDRQKCILEKDRKVYYEWLISYGEDIIMKRRFRIREKCVEETYAQCHKSIPFEVRNNYIEYRLESRFKYFDKQNDLGSIGDETERAKNELSKLLARFRELDKQKRQAEKDATYERFDRIYYKRMGLPNPRDEAKSVKSARSSERQRSEEPVEEVKQTEGQENIEVNTSQPLVI